MQVKSPLLLFVLFLFASLPAKSQDQTPDGIPYAVLQRGAGPHPQMGQEVKCHYVVSDANGTVLWSTRSVNAPDYIVLGEKKSSMARARDNCFLLMQKGSRYRFDFPKAMLETPQAADLPGAYITYDIEVLGFGAPKPSGVQRFRQIQQEQGLQAGLNTLEQMVAAHPGSYALREAELNRLGYELLQSKEISAAIRIFEMNVRLYPASFNAYDSLGDAYVAQGNKVEAKNCFEKALELNPQYDAARQKLSNL